MFNINLPNLAFEYYKLFENESKDIPTVWKKTPHLLITCRLIYKKRTGLRYTISGYKMLVI